MSSRAVRYLPCVGDTGEAAFRATLASLGRTCSRPSGKEQTEPDVVLRRAGAGLRGPGRVVPPPSGALLLDVGGGPGYFADAFEARGATYVPLDADAGELALHGREPGPRTVLGDGTALPFLTAAFDVAYSSNVAEHVAEPWRMADEMVRVTRPGGLVFLSYTLWYGPWGGHETSPWHYLGGARAADRYERTHGRRPKNDYGVSMFRTTAAGGARWAAEQRRTGRLDRRPSGAALPAVLGRPARAGAGAARGGLLELRRRRTARLVTRLAWRIRLLATCTVLVAVAFTQSPGLTAADTKLDLTQNPGAFLARALHLWDRPGVLRPAAEPGVRLPVPDGSVLLGSGPPSARRAVGRAAALVVGAARAPRSSASCASPARSGSGPLAPAGRRRSRSPSPPRVLSTIGPISAEVLPVALPPWVLVPLVGLPPWPGSRTGRGMRSGVAVLFMGGVNAAADRRRCCRSPCCGSLSSRPRAVRWLARGWWVGRRRAGDGMVRRPAAAAGQLLPALPRLDRVRRRSPRR